MISKPSRKLPIILDWKYQFRRSSVLSIIRFIGKTQRARISSQSFEERSPRLDIRKARSSAVEENFGRCGHGGISPRHLSHGKETLAFVCPVQTPSTREGGKEETEHSTCSFTRD